MNIHAAKIAITIDAKLLKKLDNFVKNKAFKSRSQAIQVAVSDVVAKLEHTQLAIECDKLDVKFEQAMADELEDIEEWVEF